MADNGANTAAAEDALTIPWAMTWPDLKVGLIPSLEFEKLGPEQQEKLRADYGDGLALLDWVKAQRRDEMGLLVMEQSTWDQLPAAIQEKLREHYGEDDGLRIFADGFLALVDTKNYPTSQRGNALVFCKLRGRDYIHTTKPAAGYHWKKLATDKGGHSGGYWAADDADTWLRAALNRLTDDLWQMYLSVRVEEKEKGKKDGKQSDPAPTATDDELKRTARNDLLVKWRSTIRDRYDSFANYELDKIAARIKAVKDEAGVKMNAPDRCAKWLPCLNGVYDLETGDFRSARPDDHMSYYAPTIYDPTAYDKNTRAALDLFFDTAKDKDRAEAVESYFWELTGTGLYPVLRKDTKAMVQMIGTKTNNGKTTLVRALMACLGDADGTGLAQSVRPEAFAKIAGANTSTLTPDFATIKWARLVFVSEPDESLRIAWSTVKDLTGGGYMKINPKNEAVYKIPAQFSMFWDTNYYLRVDDPTIFQRGTMRLVPFEHSFPETDRDPDIDKKLATPAARSYFLRLMLDGLRRYVKNKGFAAPAICQKMVADYEQISDKLGEFLASCFVKTGRPADKVPIAKTVYPAYVKWLEANNYKGVESRPEFTRKLDNRPDVTIGGLQNARAIIGYTTKEGALLRVTSGAPAVPFGGLAPLAWYLQNYTAEGPAEVAPEQLDTEGNATAAPALTLGDLAADFRQRAKQENPAAELPDDFGILAELLRLKWRLELQADILKSEIRSHHILTADELARRGQQQAQAIRAGLQKQVAEAMEEIGDERTRKAVRYLTGEGTLPQYTKRWSESVRRVILAAMLDGEPLEAATVKEAQRLQNLEAAGPIVREIAEKQAEKAARKAEVAADLEKIRADREKDEKERLEALNK